MQPSPEKVQFSLNFRQIYDAVNMAGKANGVTDQ